MTPFSGSGERREYPTGGMSCDIASPRGDGWAVTSMFCIGARNRHHFDLSEAEVSKHGTSGM